MPLHFVFDCPICKLFFIQDRLLNILPSFASDSMEKLNCIAENIHSNSNESALTYWNNADTDKSPEFDTDTATKVFEYVGKSPINHSEKAGKLLNLFAKKISNLHPFSETTLSLSDLYSLRIYDLNEAVEWLLPLSKNGLIKSNLLSQHYAATKYSIENLSEFEVRLTPLGWNSVYSSNISVNSKKVFIAMQFNWPDAEETKNQFIEAVKLGCLDCGYEADIVPQHHLEPITDKIIAGIKSSRFVVADFTFNNRGAYYEAGYARGFGVPVIHTIMDGHADGKPEDGKRLHFDIQQINYLKWSDPKEVREKIRDRIKAVIE